MNRERGSALLVSLMVMVGLSLLGLGFVAISETESVISINERNNVQTRAVAEAGVRTVIEWFQDPEWALAAGMLPPNHDALKPQRTYYASGGALNDRYRTADSDSNLLFDKPFKPYRYDRFFGSRDSADVVINKATLDAAGGATAAYLDNLNTTLFAGADQAGVITEIRVFAPPLSGATLNAQGYYEGGQRLGLATVEVTSRKCRPTVSCTSETDDTDIISQASIRAVVSEWPFPGPSGPVQTNANLASNGNFRVHWGMITATGTMQLKREFGALPWHDAYEMVAAHHGYYDLTWKPGVETRFQVNPASSSVYDRYNWLHQMTGQSFTDPWYQARTRGDYTDDGTGGPPVVWPYDDPTQVIWKESPANQRVFRSIFQDQTTNDPPERKSVLFPRVEYEFWKEIAQSSDDQDGIYYLRPVSGGKNPLYEDKNGNRGSFLDWTNTTTPSPAGGGNSQAGFYFFDTVNQLNPQDDGPGQLVEEITIQGSGNTKIVMQGFIYLNAAEMKVTGGSGNTGRFNMPGEPFRDVSFWKVNDTTGLWEVDGAANPVLHEDYSGNGKWNYQDLPTSIGGVAGEFDYFVEARASLNRPDGTAIAPADSYFIVPYFPGCNPGVDCSEPHEPYLNFRYPTSVDGAAGGPMTVGWDALKGDRKPKRTNNDDPYAPAVTCTAASSQEDCVSNAYDRDGAVVPLEPIMNGVFYNEGHFIAGGNTHWFGSVLVQGNIDQAAGTADVWFDERLVKGDWPPPEFKFPRVYVSAIRTDN